MIESSVSGRALMSAFGRYCWQSPCAEIARNNRPSVASTSKLDSRLLPTLNHCFTGRADSA